MKRVILIIFLLSCSIGFSQNYSMVHRAEKKIEQKEYAKALRLLNRAEKQDYGFCGNAHFEADSAIYELKVRLFKESNNDSELEKLLNDTDSYFESGSNTEYSIERIQLALKKYSKPELNAKITTILNNFKKSDFGNNDYTDIITLTDENGFKLKLYFKNLWDARKNEGHAYNEALVKLYTESEYYKLLNE